MPAGDHYSVAVDAGLSPTTSASHAAAIAWRYLANQYAELAAPDIHVAPDIKSVSLVRAADAKALEPAIPETAVIEAPRRTVWVAVVSGDVLNLQEHAWSHRTGADREGTIVIDDAAATILGVFPRY